MAEPDPAALCEAIVAEGRRRAEALREEARQEGEAVLEAARREADRLCREAEAEAAREAARRAERARASLEIEVGRIRADRVEALLASLRERARRELSALGGPALRRAICGQAAEALRRMEGQAFVLAVGPGRVAELGPGLAEEVLRRAARDGAALAVKEDPAVTEPGFVLRDTAGRQDWDGRLGARLDRLWPALRVALARGAGLLEAEERAP